MTKLTFVSLGRLLLLIRFSRLSRSYRLFLLSQTTGNPEKVVSLKKLKAQIFLRRCLHQTSSPSYFSLICKSFQSLDYSYLLKFHTRTLDRTPSRKAAAENAHHHHPHRRFWSRRSLASLRTPFSEARRPGNRLPSQPGQAKQVLQSAIHIRRRA